MRTQQQLEDERRLLLADRDVEQDRLNAILTQIQWAQAKKGEGEPAPADWWSRVNHAGRTARARLRRLNEQIAAVDREMKAIRKDANRANFESRQRRFIEVARAMLDRGTYLAIWDEVDRDEAGDRELEPAEREGGAA